MTGVPKNTFGQTDLSVSRVGFGTWAIGGAATAGGVAIGWGESDDTVSHRAISTALDRGVTFFDTADFYGLGHSETLLGETLGNNSDVTIATKVGHRLGSDGSIRLDYSRDHIMSACDASLKRLKRDCIDFYQLHSARLSHLKNGECIDAMERLVAMGKVRYWGLSLNTYSPQPEADYLIDRMLADGFQLVLSVINQRALSVVKRAAEHGYGVIARMPLHFGLLTGKLDTSSTFEPTDHRSFRLTKPIISQSMADLRPFFQIAESLRITPTALAIAFVLGHDGVSTVIPGMRTPEQAIENTDGPFGLADSEMAALSQLYVDVLEDLLKQMQESESRS